MSIEEIKTKQRWVEQEAFNKGNINAWDEVLAPDIVLHEQNVPDIKGLEAYKKTMLALFQGFSDFHFELDEIIGEGDTTLVRYSMNMKHTGVNPMVPLPATGKEAVFKGCIFSHWHNNKIIEQYEYSDILGFFQQLGIVPPMGQR